MLVVGSLSTALTGVLPIALVGFLVKDLRCQEPCFVLVKMSGAIFVCRGDCDAPKKGFEIIVYFGSSRM